MKKQRKQLAALGLAALLTGSMGMTAFAGQWKQDNDGYWYQNDDGSYPISTWEWIDGNGDGNAECYYFGEDGKIHWSEVTPPDGYTADSCGRWTVDGVVQTKVIGEPTKTQTIEGIYYMAGAGDGINVAGTNRNYKVVVTKNANGTYHFASYYQSELMWADDCSVVAGCYDETVLQAPKNEYGWEGRIYRYNTNVYTGKEEISTSGGGEVDYYAKD